MKIKNYTPHKLVFFKEQDCDFDPKSRKLILRDGAKPILEIDSDGALNARIAQQDNGSLNINGIAIPVVATSYDDVDELPELGDDEFAVVSFLYAQAAKGLGFDTSKLYTVMTVYKLVDGRPVPAGAVKLAKI